jgi:hypothetical protein
MGWGFGGWGLGTIAYSSGYYPYYNPYYAPIAGTPPAYSYMNPIPVAAQPPAGTPLAADEAPLPPINAAFDEAREEFRRGHYPAALNAANAAVRNVPTDAVAHEFRALVLFTMREYRQAAAAVHAVLAVGPGWDWTTMSSLYPDPAIYAQQLHALEDFSREHPRNAEAHFLLGYHYMIGSHAEASAAEFELVTRLMPTDRLAGELLLMVKGPPPATAAPDAPNTASPDAPPEPGLPPIEKGLLVGSWHASRDDGSKFRLTLAEDGTFRWKFSAPNQKGDEFGGTYTADGAVLALERKEGGVLAGTSVFVDNRHFTFRMVGGPPTDPGLEFSR